MISLTVPKPGPHPQADFNEINTLPLNGFRLLTLGRLVLEGGEGDPAADALRKQRRKLAVLAVLALAQERLTREALTEMFWGDQDEARARHSLSEALSHLRRVLGPNAISARCQRGLLISSSGAPVGATLLESTSDRSCPAIRT